MHEHETDPATSIEAQQIGQYLMFFDESGASISSDTIVDLHEIR